MKRRLTIALMAVVIGFLAADAKGQSHLSSAEYQLASPTTTVIPNHFDLESLERLALAHNPTLVQANAQVNISHGKAIQAGLYPNPQIGFVSEQIGAEGTAGELQGMFVEQEIVTGRKLQLSRQKYAQEATQAELQVFAQRCRVLYGIRKSFYDVLASARRLELRRQLAENSEEVWTTVQELQNVGQANRTDLLQSQLQRQRSKARQREAERQFQGSWEQLAAVVGLPDLPPSQLLGSLEFESDRTLDRATALNYVLTQSPQLRFARAEVMRDQIGLEREKAEPIPNIHLRAESGYNYEAQDTVAGLEIGLNIPLFDRNQGTIIQAQAELVRAQAEVARVELMLRQRFARVFTDYETSMTIANTFREDILPPAEETYQLYLDSFQQRRAAWPQVLSAQREYYELAEEYLEQLKIARHAEARINSLLLEDGLEQPPEPTPEGHRDSTPRPR